MSVMRIPYATDESGAIVPDAAAIPEGKRDRVSSISWVPDDQEYEVRFDLQARIDELEALLAQGE